MAPASPEARTPVGPRFLPVSWKNLAAALAAGLLFRLFFMVHFPFTAGDTKFYEELACNWLDHGVYGLFVNGSLLPVDMRMPGYPAFLAAIYAVAGRADKWVMLAQAAMDLITGVAAALLAARLAPESKRTVVATAALWIAALCPFTANYTAAILTESLATFFTTVALVVLAVALSRRASYLRAEWLANRDLLRFAGWVFAGGLLAGIGALVRPETPLILAAAGALLLSICVWRRANWRAPILAAAWMAVGLILPLTPWAIRNARTIGRIQFLAPYYAQSDGDFIPAGFYAWTRTWMTREQDNYLVPWKLGKGPIPIQTLPDSAFDSPAERARVADLLRAYNNGWRMTPGLDRQFAVLGRERAARHPLRTYLSIPIARALTMWLRPRVELLRYSGDLWPIREKWRENATDFDVSLGYGLLNIFYIGLGIIGAWRCRANPAAALIVAYLIFRTALLTTMPTIEPRYVVVCFPALIALGAQAFACPAARESIKSRAGVELAGVAS
jgi:4-amino-4-deoxy-L-arabinose transferase-like glycosyltransferase